MKRFFKYIAFLFTAFFVIANLISFWSLYAHKKSSFYKPAFLVNSVDKDTFDYIILGSSVGLTTLDTKQIDSISNTKGVNLSMDDTGMSSQYLMLQHFLAEGKKTKYCILAPGIAALENKNVNIGDNDYRFLMYGDRDYISDYYKNADTFASSVLYISKWLPLVGISYYNIELFYPSLQAALKPKSRNRFDDRGNYTYPKTNKKLKKREVKEQTLTFNHSYLDKIKALCQENNIELIYYFAPIRGKSILYDQQEFTIINHTQLLKGEDIYFYDDIHVNNEGRKVVSAMFADELFRNN